MEVRVITQVKRIINSTKIIDAKSGGEILFKQGHYSTPQSGRTHFQKHANNLAALGKIERCDGFYRTLGCKSEYGEHARLLTSCLAEILKLPLTAHIYREVSFSIGTRADAVVLLKKNDKGLCFVLEVAHNETHEYLQRKLNAWRNWKEATKALSELFGIPVPNFGFVVEGMHLSGATQLQKLLEEIRK
jgi:hypothetical protein